MRENFQYFTKNSGLIELPDELYIRVGRVLTAGRLLQGSVA